MNSEIRAQFPILSRKVYGRPLVYLDNAATTQKPERVIEALSRYYREMNSNIHRGVHFLSQEATEAYEQVRIHVARFIHAPSPREIIFTRGTTESVNLVASSFGQAFFKPGSEVIISAMEHHSNIVPWQLACERHGAVLRVIPVDDMGELILEELERLITPNTVIVAVTHVSNALGTVNRVKEIIDTAHQHGVPVLIDGAQAVPHMKVDVQELDADFYCFSAHKMYGPMGIGILYGKEQWLEKIPPYQGGGEMIERVTFQQTTYNELPFKFEAGTPNVGDAIAFDQALSFMEEIGYEQIRNHENALIYKVLQGLQTIPGARIIGQPRERSGVISFLIDPLHPYDLGMILDKFGVAVRTGNHCAQPIMDQYGIPGTLRVSFGVYNTVDEMDLMFDALNTAIAMLQ